MMGKRGHPKKGEEHPKPGYPEKVAFYVACGIEQREICRILDMSTKTLHDHYKKNLQLGGTQADLVVGQKLFEAAKRGDPWAIKFWLERRAGWTRKDHVEVTGKDGGAIKQEVTHKDEFAPENLSPEKMRALDFILNEDDSPTDEESPTIQ